MIVVNKVPRGRLSNIAAEGIWSHPECLHQFQGKLSRGKISTRNSFCKEMTPRSILNILNGKKATTISFLILYPNKCYVTFIPFSCIFMYFRSNGTQGELLAQELGGLPGSATIFCVASGKWLILAFICKMMTQVSPHPAVKFHF